MKESKKKNKGFSLIELLIVVAIILIIAAIAIPNLLRARRSANEGSATASMRTVGSGSYSTIPPTVLSEPGTALTVSLTTSWAGIKSGYAFAATPDDVTSAAVHSGRTHRSTGATQTGARFYFTNEMQVVRFNAAMLPRQDRQQSATCWLVA
jgi:prepilin-type N-terminal cleavage/methylation domain-containing protein